MLKKPNTSAREEALVEAADQVRQAGRSLTISFIHDIFRFNTLKTNLRNAHV